MSALCLESVSQDSVEDEYQPETVGASNLLLLQQKKYCNVTFTFPNLPDRVEAHQFCLKARSPVFAKIFEMRKSGNVEGKEIEITESTPQRFQQFLEFIYADKLDVDIAGALDLLQLSQKYKVHPLAKKCEELLKTTKIQVEDTVKVFEAARRYGHQELMNRAGQIMVKSFLNLIETDALANAEEETLVHLLERDDLNIEEVKLFQLILDWRKRQVKVSADEGIYKDELKNVVSKIRYTNMTLFEFTKLVLPTGLLSAEESLSVYSYFGSDEATRAASKIKFNTTRRIISGKVEKFVDFFAEKQFHLGSAPAFFDQRVLFKVERQPQAEVAMKEWLGCLQKTAVISRIKFEWPRVCDTNKLEDLLNFNISVMEFSNSSVMNEIKFRMNLDGCEPGTFDEIFVKPPVELIPGHKYAVVVQNRIGLVGIENLRHDPLVYYGHILSTSGCTAYRNLLLENDCLALMETHMETSYYSQKFYNSPLTLVLIKGITIELV